MFSGISDHVYANLSLWILVFGALTALMALAQYTLGSAGPWGHWLALFGSIAGGLIMVKSEIGNGQPLAEDDAA